MRRIVISRSKGSLGLRIIWRRWKKMKLENLSLQDTVITGSISLSMKIRSTILALLRLSSQVRSCTYLVVLQAMSRQKFSMIVIQVMTRELTCFQWVLSCMWCWQVVHASMEWIKMISSKRTKHVRFSLHQGTGVLKLKRARYHELEKILCNVCWLKIQLIESLVRKRYDIHGSQVSLW